MKEIANFNQNGLYAMRVVISCNKVIHGCLFLYCCRVVKRWKIVASLFASLLASALQVAAQVLGVEFRVYWFVGVTITGLDCFMIVFLLCCPYLLTARVTKRHRR